MNDLAIAAVNKLGGLVAAKFGTKVLERWTRYRAEMFFQGFIESLSEEMRSGVESAEASEALDSILNDDVKSEVLFDAYRTVCFSRSKSIGPKIVGILTGRLVAEIRCAKGVNGVRS